MTYYILEAMNNKQLGEALRLLYSYGVKTVSLVSELTEKEKMHFKIRYTSSEIDASVAKEIEDRYDILLS